MTTRLFQLAHAAVFLGALALLSSGASAQTAPAAAAGRYIVQLAPGATVDGAGVAARYGVVPIHVFRAASRGFAAVIPPGLLAQVTADADVQAVIPDRAISANVDAAAKGGNSGKPGGNSGGGGGGVAAQVVPSGVQRVGAAPGAVAYTGAGVGVAIVDTGIDFSQPDLAVAAPQFSAYGSSAQDDNGHGTHVSGIVAALNNTRDVVGVAPDATLYAVKVLSASGSGYDSDVMAGLDWVAANAAAVNPTIRVVNMSLGRPGTLDDNPALHQSVQALYNLGITVVVAAGNDPSKEVSQMVPATYPEVIPVASTSALTGTTAVSLSPIVADSASYYTTDGALDSGTGIGVNISAPGEKEEDIIKGYRVKSVGILSTRLGGGTTRMSGTSMAAPLVTGVVALLYQQNPLQDAYESKVDIMVGADDVGSAPIDGRTTGYTFDGVREGILSAAGALSAP